MSEENKGYYDQMKAMALSKGTTVSFVAGAALKTDKKWNFTLTDIWYYLLADHPEIFWYQSRMEFSYVQSGGTITYTITYELNLTTEQINTYKSNMETQALAALNAARNAEGEYEKTKALYEYIVWNTTYQMSDSDLIHSAYGALCDKKAVCDGYTKAFQYVLNYMGINNIFVWGKGITSIGQENHAWCLVQNEGDWYQCDVTWGDPDINIVAYRDKYISYAYLNITSEQMMVNHAYQTKDLSGTGTGYMTQMYTVPACIATKCCFLAREDRYVSEYDRESLGNRIIDIINGTERNPAGGMILVELKFTADTAWNDFYYALKTAKEPEETFRITGILKSNHVNYDTVTYSVTPGNMSVVFIVYYK